MALSFESTPSNQTAPLTATPDSSRTGTALGLAWIVVVAVIFGVSFVSPDLRWLANAVKPTLVGQWWSG